MIQDQQSQVVSCPKRLIIVSTETRCKIKKNCWSQVSESNFKLTLNCSIKNIQQHCNCEKMFHFEGAFFPEVRKCIHFQTTLNCPFAPPIKLALGRHSSSLHQIELKNTYKCFATLQMM